MYLRLVPDRIERYLHGTPTRCGTSLAGCEERNA